MSNQQLEQVNRPRHDPDSSLDGSVAPAIEGAQRSERNDEISPDRLAGEVRPDASSIEPLLPADYDPYHDRLTPGVEETAPDREPRLSEKLVRALETIQPGRSVVLTTPSAKIQEQIRSIDGHPSHVSGYEYRIEEREGGGFKISSVATGALRLDDVAALDGVKQRISERKAAGERAREVVTTSVPDVKAAIRERHGQDFIVTERAYLSRPLQALAAHAGTIQDSAEKAFERGAPPIRVSLIAPSLDMEPRDPKAVNAELSKALETYHLLKASDTALREKHGAPRHPMIEIVTDYPEVREFIKIANRAEKQREKIVKALDEHLSGAAMAYDPLDPDTLPDPIEISVGLEFKRLFHKDIRLELTERWGRALVDAVIPPENVKSVSSGFRIEATKPSPDDELEGQRKKLVQEIEIAPEPDRKPLPAPQAAPKPSPWSRLTAAVGRIFGS